MNMKKNNKKISTVLFFAVVLFLSVFLTCCATAPKAEKYPAWVEYPREVFPEDDFLVYVGYGNSRDDAEVSALNGLSSIFEQNIQSNTLASSRFIQAQEKGIVAVTEKKDFDQKILKKVNVENLTGVEIKDFWFSAAEYKWYAVAVLDRKQAGSLYKTMIMKNAETIRDIIKGTQEDLYSIQSYGAYDFAQEIAIENKKHLDRLYVVDYNLAETMKDYVMLPANLAEKKVKIAEEIPIAVIIDGDDDGKIASGFLDAFKAHNFIGSLDKRVRYIVAGNINYTKEDTRDGKTTKCLYNLESFLFDTKNDKQLFPVNIRGRQSHTTYEKAKYRAETEVINQILVEFSKGFDNYLSGNSEK